MRRVVCVEGIQYPGGYMVAPGALWCEDRKIPITLGYSHERLVGVATGFERDGNDVSFELTIDPRYSDELDPEKCNANVFIQPFERAPDNEDVVVRGQIRSISIDPIIEPVLPQVNGHSFLN